MICAKEVVISLLKDGAKSKTEKKEKGEWFKWWVCLRKRMERGVNNAFAIEVVTSPLKDGANSKNSFSSFLSIASCVKISVCDRARHVSTIFCAEYHLFYRALLQKTPIIYQCAIELVTCRRYDGIVDIWLIGYRVATMSRLLKIKCLFCRI